MIIGFLPPWPGPETPGRLKFTQPEAGKQSEFRLTARRCRPGPGSRRCRGRGHGRADRPKVRRAAPGRASEEATNAGIIVDRTPSVLQVSLRRARRAMRRRRLF